MRVLSELLQRTLNAYHNRAIATQEVLEELIKLAKHIAADNTAAEALGLSHEEKAFYDGLATNDCAKQVMGDDRLRVIATELLTQVRKNVTSIGRSGKGRRRKSA